MTIQKAGSDLDVRRSATESRPPTSQQTSFQLSTDQILTISTSPAQQPPIEQETSPIEQKSPPTEQISLPIKQNTPPTKQESSMASSSKIGKLYYAGVLRREPRPAFELLSERDLSYFSYFAKQSYSEFMTFFSKTVAERAEPGKRTVVKEPEQDPKNFIYTLARPDGLVGVVITDADYPALTAHQLVSQVLDAFSSKHPKSEWSRATAPLAVPEVKTLFEKYKASGEVEGIAKIQNELNSTKDVLQKTIESVLERGEKLDTLVQKSDNLNFASRSFYTQAKKQNSCCTVM